jgi:hypothetical protein
MLLSMKTRLLINRIIHTIVWIIYVIIIAGVLYESICGKFNKFLLAGIIIVVIETLILSLLKWIKKIYNQLVLEGMHHKHCLRIPSAAKISQIENLPLSNYYIWDRKIFKMEKENETENSCR